MSFRLACTIFLLISVCAFPLFFTVAVGIFSVIWFRSYYELIPLAFLSDVLYGIPLHRFHSFPFVMTLASIILVCASVAVRSQMLDIAPRRI